MTDMRRLLNETPATDGKIVLPKDLRHEFVALIRSMAWAPSNDDDFVDDYATAAFVWRGTPVVFR